ncbi:SRPBCC domain-containing protein [Kribbella sp. CA-247076]|uniref:SRPBCC domain-containing protein n=1 Tax=Kribbella sp. CA-247076 TaxID=3239941 RepID=UPI003D8C71C5
MTNFLATAETDIAASPARVWEVLTDPDELRQIWFGAEVKTDWRPGSPITWSGEYDGKAYEDRGEILEVDPGRLLKVTHFSPLSGQPDVPENYHTLTYRLDSHGTSTHLSLTQDNNASEEEAAHSRGMWEQLVAKVKETAEAQSVT